MSTQLPDGVITLEIRDVARSVASAVVTLMLCSCDQHKKDERTVCQTCVAPTAADLTVEQGAM